jgi:guanylate kinase
MAELRKRLTGRGTETAEAIELRLSKTLSEIEYVDKYDYLVVNGELDEAVNRVKAIIIAEHSKVTMTPEELVREYTEGEEE